MSSIHDTDPMGGDGPNRGDESGGDLAAGSSAEPGRVEGPGAEGGRGDDAPKTASKGINPVQHSE